MVGITWLPSGCPSSWIGALGAGMGAAGEFSAGFVPGFACAGPSASWEVADVSFSWGSRVEAAPVSFEEEALVSREDPPLLSREDAASVSREAPVLVSAPEECPELFWLSPEEVPEPVFSLEVPSSSSWPGT